jgi:hypothetical protein
VNSARVAVAVAAALAGACASQAPEGFESTGEASAELSAVGPDGASYSLPATATLTFTPTGGFATTVLLAQGVATQSFSLPVGSYAVTLSPGTDTGSTWTLTRAGDGGATTVQAVLLDAMPVTISVADGKTTPLVFHFATDRLGNVVFGTGGVDAGIVLDAGAFPMSTGTVSGTATMSVETLNGPMALNNALKFNGNAMVTYTLSLTRSGNWTFASDQACAPVRVTTTASSRLAGLAAIVQEASGGAGSICFGDGSLSGAFMVHVARTGLPSTALMKSDLPSGGTFDVVATGLAPLVFDGGTLGLGALPEPFTVTADDVSETISQGATVLENIGGLPSSTATVTLHR